MMDKLRFVSGLSNCHIPGLYSLVLSGRASPEVGMRRVFFWDRDYSMDLWDGADFRIKPHNHRQSITLRLLFGKAQNVDVKFDRFGGLALWRYSFQSALLSGEFTVSRMNREDAGLWTRELTSEAIRLHWSDVHTVTAEPGTAWLIEEGELAPPGIERCWSVSDHLTLSNDGLYIPMEARQLSAMADFFTWKTEGELVTHDHARR